MPRKSPVIPVAINTMMVMIPAKMRTGRVSFPWFDGLSATNLITPAVTQQTAPRILIGDEIMSKKLRGIGVQLVGFFVLAILIPTLILAFKIGRAHV